MRIAIQRQTDRQTDKQTVESNGFAWQDVVVKWMNLFALFEKEL